MTDPELGEFRHCMIPICSAAFNIVATYEGRERPGQWRQVNMLIGYLCPRHGKQCIDGGHQPGWLDRDALAGMTGIRCGCGWKWSPPEPSNLGQHRDQWVAHLMEAAA